MSLNAIKVQSKEGYPSLGLFPANCEIVLVEKALYPKLFSISFRCFGIRYFSSIAAS
jgi:hypothetical protein